MRLGPLLTAVVLGLSGPIFVSSAFAQGIMTSEQIVNGLRPGDTGGPGRGIRVAPQAGAPAPAAAPAAAATTVARKAPAVDLHVNFLSGSADLTPAAAKVLDQLGSALKDSRLAGNKFRIEGHTDTVGTPESNKALSEKRAAAVSEYLVTKFGIDRAILTTIGMGQDGLLVATPAQTPEARNRRVTVVNLGA